MNIILFEGEQYFPRSDERYRHILKVLKKGPGDAFFAGVVNGSEGTATILSADDRGLRFSFAPETPMRELFPVHLLVGFPRPIQLKRLLRDVASLGAASVTLCGTELGEKSYLASSLADEGAVREALLEGCVQAGGTAVPGLSIHPGTASALASLSSRDSPRWGGLVLLDVVPPGTPSLMELPLPAISREAPLLLAIGSERGWTSGERESFRAAGFSVASLGSRILRTETAATAALSIALARGGFMEGRK